MKIREIQEHGLLVSALAEGSAFCFLGHYYRVANQNHYSVKMLNLRSDITAIYSFTTNGLESISKNELVNNVSIEVFI